MAIECVLNFLRVTLIFPILLKVVVPEWGGASEYKPTEISTETFRAPSPEKQQLLQDYLASIEPLFKEYVLKRRADRKSYRDMGTFREWACEQVLSGFSGVVHCHQGGWCCQDPDFFSRHLGDTSMLCQSPASLEGCM
jgi:hypothetical protein